MSNKVKQAFAFLVFIILYGTFAYVNIECYKFITMCFGGYYIGRLVGDFVRFRWPNNG